VRIRTELGCSDAWICLCGNTPIDEGFYPCNREGEEIEPTPEEWTTHCYVCDRCGRIIQLDTLEVVGVRSNNTLTVDERKDIQPVVLHKTPRLQNPTGAVHQI
jgi:hypothetical protein